MAVSIAIRSICRPLNTHTRSKATGVCVSREMCSCRRHILQTPLRRAETNPHKETKHGVERVFLGAIARKFKARKEAIGISSGEGGAKGGGGQTLRTFCHREYGAQQRVVEKCGHPGGVSEPAGAL